MTTSGITPAPLAAVVGAGVEASVTGLLHGYVRYQGQYSGNQPESTFGAGIRYQF